MRGHRHFRVIAIVSALLLSLAANGSQKSSEPPKKAVIISTSIPRDSRGETVYEVQGEAQKDAAVVDGTLSPPVLLKQAKSKWPKSLKRSHAEADITVQGVVTTSGDCIDMTAVNPSDKEAAESAVASVAQYRFQLGTLNGRLVASLVHVVVQFRTR